MHCAERLVHHQVYVLAEELRKRRDEARADREAGAEDAVDHVHVELRHARARDGVELVREVQEIGGEDADAELRHTEALSRESSLKSSYASSGRASSWTTARTARIIAAGASLWKMLRPMSTPPAPSCTAR